MKSITIVCAMGYLFIMISGFKEKPKLLIYETKSVQCVSESHETQPIVLVSKKLKSKQMPNWQRVIPGMFR